MCPLSGCKSLTFFGHTFKIVIKIPQCICFIAVPDTAGPSGGSGGGPRAPTGPSSQARPGSGPSAGTSFGGQQSKPGSPPSPSSPGFSNQQRPGGGSGNYSPQSGYKY